MLRLIPTLLAAIALMLPSPSPAGSDNGETRQILELGRLTAAPSTHPAAGFNKVGTAAALFFDGLPYRGKPTRVFAWLGLPEDTGSPVPGIVLVHGGGGTAFQEWVQRWNDRGYAAISIAVEGQTDARPAGKPNLPWERHAWAGPGRSGIYGDSEQPLTEQWMYHAVADTILANSLLRSLPEVDSDRVGIMGVSWGGVITATVIGIDSRFAFAIPTYGCGDLATAPNQYGKSLADNHLYRQAWDPKLRLGRASMPSLWLSWTGDDHFPLDRQAACYRSVKGPHMVALVPGMRHSHQAAWTPEDSYAFADSITQEDRPWCLQTGMTRDGNSARVTFSATKAIDSALLTSTRDSGATSERHWTDSPAALRQAGTDIVVEADIPEACTGWFIVLKSGKLHACSDYQDTGGSE